MSIISNELQIQRNLNTIKRIVTKLNGSFSLTIIDCDDIDIRTKVLAQLDQELKEAIQVLTVSPETQSLHKEIVDSFEGRLPSALIVVGLESVADIEKVAAGANLTRDLFKSDMPFPLLLSMTASTLRTFSRYANDFKSWACTISLLME